MTGYTTHAYLIDCISNLHAGSGDTDYGIIDKQIQRDPSTQRPTIHSSSLKGALREYFEHCVNMPKPALYHIFGAEPTSNTTNSAQMGQYRFFGAQILALPIQAEPYEIITCEEWATDIISVATNLGIGTWPLKLNQFKKFNQQEADDYCRDLPVLARNQLDNGVSKNLWYEEIVPRKSQFVFFVLVPENDSHVAAFELHNKTVQIGGNASVGYGFCKITKIV